MQHPAVVPGVVRLVDREQGSLALSDDELAALAPVTDEPVTCPTCSRTVAWKATRPYRIRCRHCREDVER